MPKLKKFKPVQQEAIEKELLGHYGPHMTFEAVEEEMGRVTAKTARKWLESLPVQKNGTKNLYLTADFAELVYKCQEGELVVEKKIPKEVMARDEYLRERHGGMMPLIAVAKEWGFKDADAIKEMLEGVVCVRINGKRRFRTIDIAKLEYSMQEVMS